MSVEFIAAIGVIAVNLIVAIGGLVISYNNGRNAKENAASAQKAASVASGDAVKSSEQLKIIHDNTNSSLDKLNFRLDQALAEGKAARKESKAALEENKLLRESIRTMQGSVESLQRPVVEPVALPTPRRKRRKT